MKKGLKILISIAVILALFWVIPASRGQIKLTVARAMTLSGTPESYLRMGRATQELSYNSSYKYYSAGLPWFLKAAEAGYPDGMTAAAQCYKRLADHYHVDPDTGESREISKELADEYLETAARMMRRAAELGSAEAQYELLDEHDPWYVEDAQERLEWLRKSAENGWAAAQYDWGRAEQDEAKGIEWITKSARQKYEFAIVHLAYYYADPDNPRQDMEQARYWFKQLSRDQMDAYKGADWYKRLAP